ncbi:TraB/GumN family protein [Terrimonas sp. NA20]|uniref:TraB/GumN family protein n=1 Tax=Terrimonas ginsenosidimutans TaxID=2908004 RepID=A0ABS9KMQ0_9BACT|nr:TraB/GumN family protein [Terrimonas ginsenosidimutans]MCG2613589.1 TraB/GumN family protein [Terrimonas ginsenosidimutans]
MKRLGAGLLLTFLVLNSCAQKSKTKQANSTAEEKTLLWKISGNGLEKPSYLFGTIHVLCKDDAVLSDNLLTAIANADNVYLEVDLSNMLEAFSVLSKMQMKGDTTLKDLLSKEDYAKVRAHFEKEGTMLPFSVLEKYKPILASSLLMQGDLPCDKHTAMEQEIMTVAKKHSKKIKGLETMSYQAEVLDGIPYKMQAQQLVSYVDQAKNGDSTSQDFTRLMDAYREQDLHKLEALMLKDEAGIAEYSEILLFNRNRNWIEKMKQVLPGHSFVFAVGAGHLPGEQGVINLLRKAGYTVSPVANKTVKTI